ncbi:hypothetical protein JCM18899A_26450 [Nocardioides sp. AN3]
MSEPQTGAKRYPRTFGGLVGSMIVLVAAVVGYWVIQNLTHDQPEGKPVGYDYLATVGSVQGAGIQIAYPRSLPHGWIANGEPNFTPGDRPAWGLPMLTDHGRFVGIQQQDAPLQDLLDTALPSGARQGAEARIESDLPGKAAKDWSSWSSGNGDHAFATKVGNDTLLVYGSAPVSDLKTLIGRLTTAPVA